jgi:hypothetical protein
MPVHSHTLVPGNVTDTRAVITMSPQSEEVTSLSKANSEPVFSSFLERFQYLIKSLPESVPKASDYDKFAIFSAKPCNFDDTNIPSGELWEEVVNKILKSVFGWGMEGNMDSIICRGKKGLDGLAEFVKYFVVK